MSLNNEEILRITRKSSIVQREIQRVQDEEKKELEEEHWQKGHDTKLEEIISILRTSKISDVKILVYRHRDYESYDKIEIVTDKGIITIEGWFGIK